MADMHSKETRSFNMSRIRSKNTKPELHVRGFLFANGFRYRLHEKKLPGKPDLVLPKFKTVIFVHGCFWHGHEGCRFASTPKSNVDYWIPKIEGNTIKDNDAIQLLKKVGWKVIIIWECELKKAQADFTLSNLKNILLKVLIDQT